MSRTSYRTRTSIGGLLPIIATSVPVAVYGLGVRIPNQDPAAIARGNAFVATADNPSAIYYNPAGITQLEGHNAQIASLFYSPIFADYKSSSGQRVENDSEILPVPSVHYTFTPEGKNVSFGLGIYSPFGLRMSWPEDAPFATGGYDGKLTYITANPVIAVKLPPSLSLAIGPTINYSELELTQRVGILPGDYFRFRGDDYGFGFNAGIRWTPYEEWAFGLTYRSKVDVNYEGNAAIRPSPPLPGKFKSSAPLEFPQVIAGGVSFRPTTNWNVEVNVDWTDWSSVETLSIRGVPDQTLNWKSSFFYQVGATRQLPHGFFASAGYFFSERSTSERYFIPTVPDTDLHVGSVGLGHKGRHVRWAAAFQLIGGDYRTIDNNVNATVNGRYRLLTPAFSLSMGYHF